MSQPQRLSAGCTVDDIVAANEADGVAIIEGWLSAELLERFNQELSPWLERHQGTNSGSQESDQFLGLKTRRLQGLCAKTPAFVDILLDARLLGFAEAVLAPVAPGIVLNNGEVIDIGPGEQAQPFHRDDDAWNFVNQSSPLMINSIVALEDITPKMGSTLLVPGSHRWDRDRRPTHSEVVSCTLDAGSALFFRGDTLHAGGANHSDRRRRALSTGLCSGWLRPVENSYTSVPFEVVKQLPERARDLLGYALYDASRAGGGYLGYHDMGDPRRLFD